MAIRDRLGTVDERAIVNGSSATSSDDVVGDARVRTRPMFGTLIAPQPASWTCSTSHQGTLRCGGKVAFHCTFHVVWCTQYRVPVLGDEVARRLRELVTEVVAQRGAWLEAMNVSPVHVDVMLEVSPQLGIHRLVKAIKARSARALRDEFPQLRSRLPSLWTNAYLVETVGHEVSPSMI